MAIDESLFDLTVGEIWWRDRFNLLESRGYRLRPRYKPDWKPSWAGTGKHPRLYEDSICSASTRIMDATRISDGKTVFIKKVIRDGREKKIAEYLTEGEKLKDPRNHCVPILDHFDDDKEPYTEFIVMPMLRLFDSPPFSSVDEVVDFVRQSLEGLSFIHGQNVAHRDLASGNIMFDGSSMYRSGFHPVLALHDTSGLYEISYLSRRSVKGVRYYIIDFGISTLFEGGESHLVTGSRAQDSDVPELSESVPYDAFAVDVFTLGNLYKKELIQNYTNLEFLSPLAEAMTRTDPKERPNVNECVQMFDEIVSNQTTRALNWKLKSREMGKVKQLWQDFTSVVYVARLFARRFIPHSSPA